MEILEKKNPGHSRRRQYNECCQPCSNLLHSCQHFPSTQTVCSESG